MKNKMLLEEDVSMVLSLNLQIHFELFLQSQCYSEYFDRLIFLQSDQTNFSETYHKCKENPFNLLLFQPLFRNH